jgi:hypothetical protein
MPRRRHATLALLSVSALLLAGCSPSSDEAIEASALTADTAGDPVEPIGPGSQITFSTFEWGFEVLDGMAVDGALEITLDNIGEAAHNIRFDAAAGEVNEVVAGVGEETTGEILLFGAPDGQTYTYYCSIPGHRANGMEGELIVYLTPEDAEANPVQPEDMMG